MYHRSTIKIVLKRNHLRILGPVTRSGIVEPHGKIRNLEIHGWRPPGRPKKTWAENVEEDLRKTGAMEEDALNRAGRRLMINRLTC